MAYLDVMKRMMDDPKVQRMKLYEQHKCSNTYEHVMHVARVSHSISDFFHLKVNEESMITGAILHDYYLYSFHNHPIGAYEHGTTHASRALENAERDFELDDISRSVIYSHMWPLNLTRLPKTKEAWVVTAADKICAFSEMVLRIQPQS